MKIYLHLFTRHLSQRSEDCEVDTGSAGTQRIITAIPSEWHATHLNSLRLVGLGNENVQSKTKERNIFIRFNKLCN